MVRDPAAGSSGRTALEIVAGQDERVGKWIVEHIPDINQTPGGYSAIGIARDGELVGGVLYTNYRRYRSGGDIEVWCAGHDWVSRKIVGVCLGYPFYQLGCHRLTALVRLSNKASRRFVEVVFFNYEGLLW